MHSVFQPGFPGLLEAIYIQERLVEQIMPAVFKSFVSIASGFTCSVSDADCDSNNSKII